jgi:hypothetical protein
VQPLQVGTARDAKLPCSMVQVAVPALKRNALRGASMQHMHNQSCRMRNIQCCITLQHAARHGTQQ